MRTAAYLGLAGALMFALAAPAVAQEQPQDPPDLKAYRQIYDPQAMADKKAELAEAFLAEAQPAFSESVHRDNVFLILFQSYKELGKWSQALDAVDRLDKLVPKTPPDRKLLFYAEAMNIALSEAKDTKRTIGYAEKIVAIDPNNVNALLTLATAIPPLPEDTAARETVFNQVVEHGKKVLSLPRPEAVPEDKWQSIRSAIQVQNQSLIAMVLLDKKDYVGCGKAYESLTQMTPRDAAAQYRLGICRYYQVRAANEMEIAANKAHIAFIEECNKTRETDKGCESEANKSRIAELDAKEKALKKDFETMRDSAIEAFARAVAIGGPGPEVIAARSELEKLYRTKSAAGNDKPLEGLEDLIAQKKKELGV